MNVYLGYLFSRRIFSAKHFLIGLFCVMVSACTEVEEQSSAIAGSQPEQAALQTPPGEPTSRKTEKYQLSANYAQFRRSQISNPIYTLSLDLTDLGDSYSGKVDIEFELAENNNSAVTIDFERGEIFDLQVNGVSAEWDYDGGYISLAPGSFVEGRNLVSIGYRRPYSKDGAGLHKFTDPENGEVYLYSDFEPFDANRMFPHFDQPDLKAPLKLDVLAPKNWLVIANAREHEIIALADSQHWKFPVTPLLSSYVYAVHAGPYHVWEDKAGDIPLRLFVRNSLAGYVKTEEWFVPTKQSFGFFQDYFDMPYPFEKYDQVIAPDFNSGAMENAAAVTFSEGYVSRGEKSIAQKRRLATTIAHEMAHMWFGDLVTMSWWNGLWLNESFATYMANIALEGASDFENVWDSFYSRRKLSAYQADQRVTTHPVDLNVASTDDAFSNFDAITYGKGASVLKQLPYFLGADNFRQGVRNYLKKYAYRNTSLEDFVGELARAADIDLTQWQEEWLYQSGVNTLAVEFSCDQNKLTALRLRQDAAEVETADKVLRSQRTQIGLYKYLNGEMKLQNVLSVRYEGALTKVEEAQGLPCPDLVFPNEDDWAYAKIALDARSLQSLKLHINDIAKPTTRLMLWQSLWENVLDIRLPLNEYVGFVRANLGREEDANVVAQVTFSLQASFAYYSRMGGFRAEKLEIESFLRQQLMQAESGSELQKLWYAQLVGLAHSDKALAYLIDLLSGQKAISGLTIDQDKRWNIVVALNRYQYADYQQYLDDEALRDTSDTGVVMALAARAIQPDERIKAEWLNTIINKPESFKLVSLRRVMRFLFPSEQTHLKAVFKEQLLESSITVNESSNLRYINEYARNLLPALCTPESVDNLRQGMQTYTALAGYKPQLVKGYLLAHQEDQRCVNIAQNLSVSENM